MNYEQEFSDIVHHQLREPETVTPWSTGPLWNVERTLQHLTGAAFSVSRLLGRGAMPQALMDALAAAETACFDVATEVHRFEPPRQSSGGPQ